MTFPFAITQQIQDAYQAHQAYISAGTAWLIRNDPDAQEEQVLLEEIVTQIESAAQEHFGDDEDAFFVAINPAALPIINNINLISTEYSLNFDLYLSANSS